MDKLKTSLTETITEVSDETKSPAGKILTANLTVLRDVEAAFGNVG
ncbi:hypothetical protein [Methylosarcina fibrata]|nr:hypothetical protein [Methylosarcina fibrata]